VVAAGHLAFALGSDTNGSIRVPASLCGLYGLKPTHADLPLEGTFPFAHSFDDIGPFTGSLADMRAIWSVLSARPDDAGGMSPSGRARGPVCRKPRSAQAEAIARIVGEGPVLSFPDLARYRSAAFLITAYEGGALHRETLARAAMDYDPAVRDRLIAGSLLPATLYEAAQALRATARDHVDAMMEEAGVDVMVAPGTPCVAPLIADPRIAIDGAMVPARADLGIHTQPITFLGLPRCACRCTRGAIAARYSVDRPSIWGNGSFRLRTNARRAGHCRRVRRGQSRRNGNDAKCRAATGAYFDLEARGTNIRTEVVAGATTFLTMAYIVLVNPRSWGRRGCRWRRWRRRPALPRPSPRS
jgi:Asp-tRNA(Asn)/Glu-tRNA(Gln) amidotransferase A subunit family amidase